jgi:hypothetical protein
LGALGALMVFMNTIAGATLGTLEVLADGDATKWPVSLLIYVIATSTLSLTVLVIWLIRYLAINKPWYLFNPNDIAPEAHAALYSPGTPFLSMKVSPTDLVSLQVVADEEEE